MLYYMPFFLKMFWFTGGNNGVGLNNTTEETHNDETLVGDDGNEPPNEEPNEPREGTATIAGDDGHEASKNVPNEPLATTARIHNQSTFVACVCAHAVVQLRTKPAKKASSGL
jgi:hypothetical protein